MKKKELRHERQKLANYLGARTSHRFVARPRSTKGAREWWARLIFLAILLLLIGLGGAWRELSATKKERPPSQRTLEDASKESETSLSEFSPFSPGVSP